MNEHSLKSSPAFTLLELLVAIAIVAVLMVLGLKTGAALQKSGDNARCVSNLRQAGSAMLLYFNDRNGRFFPGKNWFAYPSTKALPNSGMRDYFGVISSNNNTNSPEFLRDTVLTCPTMKKAFPNLYPSPLNRGYAINAYLYTVDPASTNTAGDPMKGAPQRISNVPNIPAMWILSEAPENGFLLGSTDAGAAESPRKYLKFVHEGFQNVVYLDGHLERLRYADFVHPPNRREFWGNLDF